MKLLLDENLSPRLIAAIEDLYPGSRHIEDCGLISAPDEDIWNYAARNGFAIVTKDSDYSERSVIDGFPPKIVWLRIGNCTTMRALEALRNHVGQIQAFLQTGAESCLVISTPPSKDVKSVGPCVEPPPIQPHYQQVSAPIPCATFTTRPFLKRLNHTW